MKSVIANKLFRIQGLSSEDVVEAVYKAFLMLRKLVAGTYIFGYVLGRTMLRIIATSAVVAVFTVLGLAYYESVEFVKVLQDEKLLVEFSSSTMGISFFIGAVLTALAGFFSPIANLADRVLEE